MNKVKMIIERLNKHLESLNVLFFIDLQFMVNFYFKFNIKKINQKLKLSA